MKKKYLVTILLSIICVTITILAHGQEEKKVFSKTSDIANSIIQCELPTAAGTENQKMIGINIVNKSKSSKKILTSLTFSMKGTSKVKDVKSIKLFNNGNNQFFDADFKRNPLSRLVATYSPPSNQRFVYKGNIPLKEGNNYFFITYDISKNAKEGNILNANIEKFSVNNLSIIPDTSKKTGSRFVALENQLLWYPGKDSSKNYRIPAITTTKKGTLIAAIDKRNEGNSDIFPDNNIDIVVKRSIDKGKHWSPSIYVWGENTTKTMSDPSLLTLKDGTILLMANMGNAFGKSIAYDSNNPDATIRPIVVTSKDDGNTWSDTTDLAGIIYSEIPNLVSSFISSGHLLQIKRGPYAGRILGVLVTRYSTGGKYGNHILYSDDNGETWHASPNDAASGNGGDEAKVVELNDGTILLSSRKYNARLFNTSIDGGISWAESYQNEDIADPACNGDILRFTSILEGDNQNRLIHSIPYNIGSRTRKNVSILLSYDEGKTWPIRKSIASGFSGYSALTVLKDNTIGILYESGEYTGIENEYDIYFTRVSLNWLTNGKDTLKNESSKNN